MKVMGGTRSDAGPDAGSNAFILLDAPPYTMSRANIWQARILPTMAVGYTVAQPRSARSVLVCVCREAMMRNKVRSGCSARKASA